MSDFIVKNTTSVSILDLFCPHFCRGCGCLGRPFCKCCKNYIVRTYVNYCPACYEPSEGKCTDCELPFDGLYMVGWRDTEIGELVEEYKYQSVRSAGSDLAEMLDAVIPCLKGEVVVVPLPTIRKHIRARGFDHTKAVARKLARRRGWKMQSVLVRAQDTVQVGADNEQRKKQASEAFELKGEICRDVTYLLFDDIWTTGASMMAGAELLKEGGATKIMGAVIAVSRMKLVAGDGVGGSGGVGRTANADSVEDEVDDRKSKDSDN